MNTEIEIDVTEIDLKAGRRCNCRECPIALAAIRAFQRPVLVGVQVGVFGSGLTEVVLKDTLIVKYDYGIVVYKMPPEAVKAIGYIDDSEVGLVSPFKFKVSLQN